MESEGWESSVKVDIHLLKVGVIKRRKRQKNCNMLKQSAELGRIISNILGYPLYRKHGSPLYQEEINGIANK